MSRRAKNPKPPRRRRRTSAARKKSSAPGATALSGNAQPVPVRDEADERTADARDRADILDAAADQTRELLTSTNADRAKALRLLQVARRRAAHLVIEAKRQSRQARETADVHAQQVLRHAMRQADDFVADADRRAADAREAVRQAQQESERLLADARRDAEQQLDDAADRARELVDQAEVEVQAVLKKAAADAEERVAAAQTTADGTRNAGREEANRILAEARKRADALGTQASAQAEEVLRTAEEHADRSVAEAESRARQITDDAERALRDATAAAERLRREAETDATSTRTRAEEVLGDAERELEEARQAAERLRKRTENDAERLRREAQEDADTVRRRADLDAARVTSAARQEADEMQQSAQDHLVRAHAESERIINAAQAEALETTEKAQAACERAEELEQNAVEALEEAEAKGAAADERWRKALSSTERRLKRRKLRRRDREDRQEAARAKREKARQRRRDRRADRPSLARRLVKAGQWSREVTRRQARRVLVGGPILAPMAVAWWSQTDYAVHAFGWWAIFGIGFAAAWELTTAFTGWMYHQARRMGDGGLIYRIATWIFAAGAAAMNYAHHCGPGGRPTQPAIAFATMSVVGMVLWELYALLVHRQYLREQGKLPQPRPRLGLIRWARFTPQAWTAWSLTINDSSLITVDLAWNAAGQERERRAALRNAEAADRAALAAGLTMQRLVVPRTRIVEDPRAAITAIPLFQPVPLPFRAEPWNALPAAPMVRNDTGRTDAGTQTFHEAVERTESDPAVVRSTGTVHGPLPVPVERTGTDLGGFRVPDCAAHSRNADADLQQSAGRSGPHEPERTGRTGRTPRTELEHPLGTANPAERTAEADRDAFRKGGTDRRNSPGAVPEHPTERVSGTDREPAPGGGTEQTEPVLNELEQAAVERLRDAQKTLSKRNIASEVRKNGGSISDKRAGLLAVTLAKPQKREPVGV